MDIHEREERDDDSHELNELPDLEEWNYDIDPIVWARERRDSGYDSDTNTHDRIWPPINMPRLVLPDNPNNLPSVLHNSNSK